jgi:PAS domain S-box-containing protein
LGELDGVTSTAGPGSTIVLVDDSSELRALVRRRLERTGQFVVVGEGADGDEAISLAIRLEPDLILLDTSMPTCDGLQALPAILAVCPETRVVMFTGFEERGLADRARELGAADFMEKSMPLSELPDRLLRVLRRPTAAGPVGQQDRDRLHVVRAPPENAELVGDQSLVDEHVAQFQDLFEQAAIGMATLTVTGSIVRANPALAALMSCRPFDLVGVDYGRLTGGLGADLDQALADIAAEGRDLALLEHPLPGAEELARTARLTLAPIRDSQGRVLYVFAQVQDITELRAAESHLRASEEHFRLLVAAVSEYAIYMLDVDGNVASWNVGAQRIKGYDADEIIGSHFRVFYPPDEQQAGHPNSNLALALRDGAYAEEGWRVRKDGSRFWASVVISPVYDDAGVHIGFAKVTHDQTSQRLHEQDRQLAADQQTHLLAVAAHELRTPTAVIEGSARALQDALQDAEQDTVGRAGLLSSIRGSADRLRRLAADLATASQVEGGTLRHEPQEVLVADLLRRAGVRAGLAGIEVVLSPPEPPVAIVRADPVRFAQALDNLIDNGGRHGRPPVSIWCEVEEEAVLIRVDDAGGGVDAELVPRLFTRFILGGPRRGTGLGLFLVREIVQAHGGEVAYRSQDGDGPRGFEIRLPTVG